MDISYMQTREMPVVRVPSTQPPVVPLPAHKSAKAAQERGLRHWLAYERRKWWLTVAFVLAIFALELGGLSLAMATNHYPDPLRVFPRTPTVTPFPCPHETLYLSASGQLQNIGYTCGQ